MVRTSLLKKTLAVLLGVLVTGHVVSAAQQHMPTSLETKVIDLALGQNGTLIGKVVDRQGVPQVGIPIKLAPTQGPSLQLRTGEQGRFIVRGLRGGQYRVTVDKQSSLVRLWATATAPPHAHREAMFVVGITVRGQRVTPGHFDGILWRALQNPWIVGGMTAAAIAIPLALDNRDAS